MDMKKMIEGFHAAYNDAFNQGDATACAALFSEDITLLPPGEPIIRGRQAFEECYEARIKESQGQTHTNELVDFGVDGDLAYEIGTYAVLGSDPPERGKFVNIFKRQPDGQWMPTVSIFNSDTP